MFCGGVSHPQPEGRLAFPVASECWGGPSLRSARVPRTFFCRIDAGILQAPDVRCSNTKFYLRSARPGVSGFSLRRRTHPRWRKIRSHFRTALATDPADEPVLDVGKPKVIRPEVGADPDVMATVVIPTIDQHIADARRRAFRRAVAAALADGVSARGRAESVGAWCGCPALPKRTRGGCTVSVIVWSWNAFSTSTASRGFARSMASTITIRCARRRRRGWSNCARHKAASFRHG